MIHALATVTTLVAASSKKTTSSSSYTFLLFLLVIGVALYFLFLRPQQQKAKRQREANSQVEVGDEVLTVGGMVGRIVDMEGDRVTVETGGDGGPVTRLVFVRNAISRKLEEAPSTDEHPEFELDHSDGQLPGVAAAAEGPEVDFDASSDDVRHREHDADEGGGEGLGHEIVDNEHDLTEDEEADEETGGAEASAGGQESGADAQPSSAKGAASANGNGRQSNSNGSKNRSSSRRRRGGSGARG